MYVGILRRYGEHPAPCGNQSGLYSTVPLERATSICMSLVGSSRSSWSYNVIIRANNPIILFSPVYIQAFKFKGLQ